MIREESHSTIANTCDIMRREGLTTMDYMEQFSWLLFLKSFEETENNPEVKAAYASAVLSTGNDRAYDRILAGDLFAPPPPAVAGEGELW